MIVLIYIIFFVILGSCQRTITFLFDRGAIKLKCVNAVLINLLVFNIKTLLNLNSPHNRLVYAFSLCFFIFPFPNEIDNLYFVIEGPCEKVDSDIFDEYFLKAATLDQMDWDFVDQLASESDSIEYCVLKPVYSKELNRTVWIYDVQYNQLLKDQMEALAQEPITRENWKSRI